MGGPSPLRPHLFSARYRALSQNLNPQSNPHLLDFTAAGPAASALYGICRSTLPSAVVSTPKCPSRSAGRRTSKLQRSKEFYPPRVVAPVPTKYWSHKPTIGVSAELHLLHHALVKQPNSYSHCSFAGAKLRREWLCHEGSIRMPELSFTVNSDATASIHDDGIVILHVRTGCLYTSNRIGSCI